MAISSNVSKQSLTKAGQMINNLFIPSAGNSAKRISVKGVSHPLPNLD